jgi:hypothetical protein
VFASAKATPRNSAVVPLLRGIQVFPPSIVLRIVPPAPTAVPVFALVKKTDRSVFVVPLLWLTQLVPPFVVVRIVPLAPTAVPVTASVKKALLRMSVGPCC